MAKRGLVPNGDEQVRRARTIGLNSGLFGPNRWGVRRIWPRMEYTYRVTHGAGNGGLRRCGSGLMVRAAATKGHPSGCQRDFVYAGRPSLPEYSGRR